MTGIADTISFLVTSNGVDYSFLWSHFIHISYGMAPDRPDQELSIHMSSADIQINGQRLHTLFQRFRDQASGLIVRRNEGAQIDPKDPVISTITVTLL